MQTEDKEIDGKTYRLTRLDAMTQAHITRRLSGVIIGMGESLKGVEANDIFATIGPIATALGKMEDKDFEYIVRRSLLGVAVVLPGGSTQRMAAPNGAIMYEDLQLPTLIRLVVEVLRFNLADFFPAIQSILPGSPAASN